MGRNAPSYSEKQKRALAQEALRLGNTKQAIRAAQAGTLPGLTAQEARDIGAIAYNYACRIVRGERMVREGRARPKVDQTMPVKAGEIMAGRILVQLDRELQKIEGKPGNIERDAVKLGRIAKATREAVQLAKEASARPTPRDKPAGTDDEPTEPAEPTSLVDRLAQQHATEPPGPTHTTPQHTPIEQNATHNENADTDTDTTRNATDTTQNTQNTPTDTPTHPPTHQPPTHHTRDTTGFRSGERAEAASSVVRGRLELGPARGASSVGVVPVVRGG